MLVKFSFKQLSKTGFVFFLLIQSAALHAEVKQNAMTAHQRAGSMPMAKEIIPPPPPGPYMSLALSDAKQHTFKRGEDEPAKGFETPDASMETFDPDVPWPDNIRKPNLWMPENGYHFVQPPATQNMHRGQPYAAPANNYGYGRPPNMNNMGSQNRPAGNAPYGNYPPPGYRYPNYQQPANYNYYYGPTANPSSNTPGYPN